MDLSMTPPEDGEEFDDRGWTVFVQEGETVTPLQSNGLASFTGLELGQTFYFSRVMDEGLNSPTLQLGTVDRNFSVFLDGELIYTDCPELDNRIGYLHLPMRELDRTEPLTINLPLNYAGKTLTIAQSFPEYSETPTVRAVPCSVRLYCGYAYESELIAETAQSSFAAMVMFLVGLALLISFLRSRDASTLCICLIAFVQMSIFIRDTSFFTTYFGEDATTWFTLVRPLAAGLILLFLSLKAGKHRKILLGITGAYGVALVIFAVSLIVLNTADAPVLMLCDFLKEWVALIGFIAVLVFGGVIWRKENRFYRIFTPLALIFLLSSWILLVILDDQVGRQIMLNLQSGQVTYIYARTLPQIVYAALITALYEAIQNAWKRYTEKQLVRQQQELAYKSYEALRRHNEEVMILRHDMNNHFRVLQDMSGEARVKAYLDELLGQYEKIRPVVQSGNEMLDIILNGKLSTAMDAGIQMEVERAKIPEKLPLSDADLCSLVMNIVDNAITAASGSGADTPYLHIKVHVKSDFLVLVCENSANMGQIRQEQKEETVPKHGLGLKIVRNITERYNGIIDTEYGENYYKVQIAIPLL